jgi:xylan 1,4-beta-xylosidase
VTDLSGLPPASLKLTVDAEKVVGELNHDFYANFGGGSTYKITAYEYNQPFWELNRVSGAFQYTRPFGIFCDGIPYWMIEETKKLLQGGSLPLYEYPAAYYNGCQVYAQDEEGNPKYNFWYLDQVLDTLLSAGIKPVVQCGLMPDALAEGEKLRAHEGGLINTPKDYNKWRDLSYNTVKHCIERYGAEEVRSWYFVLWNEPDLPNGAYFGSSLSNYLKMYDFFADGAKAADPQVKVGGVEIALEGWFSPFLQHCLNGTNYATGAKGAPLDVISWHQYGNVQHLLTYNRTMMNTIQQFPSFKDCPTLVTEWGRELIRRNEQWLWVDETNAEDQYTNYEAAYLCKYVDGALREIKNQPSRFLRSGATTKITDYYRYLSLSYGQHFVTTPVLNAYLLLAKLGSEQVKLTGGDGFAARTPGGVQVLIYNFDEKDRKSAGITKEVDLTVKGLPATWSKMKRYQIDKQNSNAWTGYTLIDPSIWTMPQLVQWEGNSRLKIIEQTDNLETKDGQVTFRLTMPANSVSLVVIGEEATPPIFTPSPHIAEVMQEEAAYKVAEARLDNSDIDGAKAGFEQLVTDSFAAVTDKSSNNPYSLWGQKALFALLDIAKKRNDSVSADEIRLQLLATTLTDVERFVLLNERLSYLGTTSNTDELQAVTAELQTVRSKLEYFASWSKWAKGWGEW